MSKNDDFVRDDKGRYVETLSSERVLGYLHRLNEPATAAELAKVFDCSNRGVLNKLNTLHERGAVERKDVGSRAVVWWATERRTVPDDAESLADVLGGFGMLDDVAGEEFADVIERGRTEMNERMEERSDALSRE